VVTFNLSAAEAPEYESLKAEAEKFYAAGSYAKANELYARVREVSNSPSNEARWVSFRHAETQWRSQSATQTADTTKLDQARGWLEQLLRETQRVEDRDQTRAETQESLGDFFWTRRNQQNLGVAWPHYQQALDSWAGPRDTELARVPPAGCMKFKPHCGADTLKFVNSPTGKQVHLRGTNAKVIQLGAIRVSDGVKEV